ncbi:glutathione-disulfide reductase [Piscinibacter sp. XHJ-5]|uniref:glutathione-disulfide reductase n=1 Tax=Piscinibacter sp. XHJ-5 TaxID=3037797 RepID=UPI0024534FC8|nr:glutathione-disulfide reductase [Piscinibacter sp. XHJ-5]
MADDLDLFVIGGGSGGVRAARMAAQRGAKVAVAEMGALGGTCVNVGCIPKKLYSYAAHFSEAFEEAHGFGWPVKRPEFDWELLKSNRALEIERLNSVYEAVLLAAQATLLRGRARIVSPHEVVVDGQRFRARHILVATGAHPLQAQMPGAEHAVSSNEMFDLPRFPQRLIVVGGGYIACEMASIFRGLGAQVTQLVRGSRLLRGFDDDAAAFLAVEMGKKGVDIRLGTHVQRIGREGDTLHLTQHDGQVLEADTVLMATGRVANTQGLGLEDAGVALGQRGEVIVDAHYRTNVPSILALGDVTDRIQLTPVALGEAMVLVDRLFGPGKRRMDYELIPTTVFTHPNLGTVGLTESEARQRHAAVRTYVSEFRSLKHTLSGSSERTLMKLVVDDATDRVVGLHMVGADAGETVQGFAVALRAGATKAVFDSTVGIHPTAAEEFVTMREPAAR